MATRRRTLDPTKHYLERKAAGPPGDAIRARLGGLEFELERATSPTERADPLQPELGDANRFWVIPSSLEHGLPVVELIFEFDAQSATPRVRPRDYRVRETFTCSDDTLAERFS